MKKALLLIAATVLSTQAWASKARNAALQNSYFLNDYQSIFENPAKIGLINDQATFEYGSQGMYDVGAIDDANSANTTPDAEGGFIKSYNGAKYGVYLGRKSARLEYSRYALGFLGQENPVEFTYGWNSGEVKYGVALSYSASAKRSITSANMPSGFTGITGIGAAASESNASQTTYGVRLGAAMGAWNFALLTGLASEAKFTLAGATGGAALNSDWGYKMKPSYRLNVGYELNDAMYLYGWYENQGYKTDISGTQTDETDLGDMSVNFVHHFKADAGNWYYSVGYRSVNTKVAYSGAFAAKTNVNETDTSMPVAIGVEADAASWLTLRTSVSENLIIGSQKPDGGDASSVPHNTTANAGVGMKFNKFVVDGTLSAQADGKLDFSGPLLANLSTTYNF